MSAYENVVGGKLRLKGEALKETGAFKKKLKRKHSFSSLSTHSDHLRGDNAAHLTCQGDNENEIQKEEEKNDERLTPAERRYLQQIEKLELKRIASMAKKSQRDRIQEFNQCLANLTEHYDIPKVGPG